MMSAMDSFINIAVKYGKVDPNKPKDVRKFFDVTLPTFSPKKQQAIVDELFQNSVGTTGHVPQKSAKKKGIVLADIRRYTILSNRRPAIRRVLRTINSDLDDKAPTERPRRKSTASLGLSVPLKPNPLPIARDKRL